VSSLNSVPLLPRSNRRRRICISRTTNQQTNKPTNKPTNQPIACLASNCRYGLGAGLFFVSYCAFQIPSSLALARFGAPAWLGVSVAAWGLVAASFALVQTPRGFLLLRLALGAAESGAFPSIWAHLAKFYTPRELGSRYAAAASSTALAQVLGAPVAAALLALDRVFFGIRGWQLLFIVEGLGTVAFAGAIYRSLARSPGSAEFLSPRERLWLQARQGAAAAAPKAGAAAAADAGAAAAGGGQLGAVRAALRDFRVWWMAAVWVAVAAAMFGIVFFGPLMIRSFAAPAAAAPAAAAPPGAPPPRAPPPRASCGGEGPGGGGGALVALLASAPFAAAAAAMVLNARHAEAADERHRHAGLPVGGGALCFAAAAAALALGSPAGAFLSLTAAAACVWAFHGPFMSWPANFLPPREAAAAFAVVNSVGSAGGLLGPLLLGTLADRTGSYSAAMLALAALLAAASAALLSFPAPARPAGAGGGAGGEGAPVPGHGGGAC
jgi:ACS family tartrate transporter-like MFS transporter